MPIADAAINTPSLLLIRRYFRYTPLYCFLMPPITIAADRRCATVYACRLLSIACHASPLR